MTAEPFTLDPTKLHAVPAADSMGFLGDLSTAAQACRAAFLIAEVGALEWNRERWPDLLFGVWSDAEAPATDAGRRRRATDEHEPAQLNTWLQLRPSWPQLGGPPILWPPEPTLTGPANPDARIEQIAAAVHDALNTIHRRTMLMARTLTADPPRALTSPPVVAVPARESSRTFTASELATSEAHIGDVLARLARNAEADAAATHTDGSHHVGVVAHIGHAITALPVATLPADRNGASPRFLVTLTATIDSRPRPNGVPKVT